MEASGEELGSNNEFPSEISNEGKGQGEGEGSRGGWEETLGETRGDTLGGSKDQASYSVVLESWEHFCLIAPGDSAALQMSILNDGEFNDSYEVIITQGPVNDSARDWVSLEGLDENQRIMVRAGEAAYLDIKLSVPSFTSLEASAYAGEYGFGIKARSTNNSTVEDSLSYTFPVTAFRNISLWSDFPFKSLIMDAYQTYDVSFMIHVQNLGNAGDEIELESVNEAYHLNETGEYDGLTIPITSQFDPSVMLESLEEDWVKVTFTLPGNSDPGDYVIILRANSAGEPTVFTYLVLNLELHAIQYGLHLEKFPTAVRKVNPADSTEIEFKFTLANTGNYPDNYTVEVETELGSGIYKGWTMEFEDRDGNRVHSLSVPANLRNNIDCALTDCLIPRNDRMDITLHVIVAPDEEEGHYSEIAISATSDSDGRVVQYLYFNLTVTLPNIRLDDDPFFFYINPDSDIEEDDSIDINIRVFNDGGAETGSFYVLFYNGRRESPNELPGFYISIERVDNIPAGQYFDVTTEWDEIPGGENDIYVYADKPIQSGDGKTFICNTFSLDGLVIESRENDNTATISDVFQQAIDLRPDLTILKVDYDDREMDSTTTVTVTIANVGSAVAQQGSAIVSLKIGGIFLKDKESNHINPELTKEIDINDDIEMEFIWEIPDEDKNFTVKANVDHPDDSNSKNDRLTVYVQTNYHRPIDVVCGPSLLPLCGLVFSLIIISIIVFLMKREKLHPMKPITTIPKHGSKKKRETRKKAYTSQPPKKVHHPNIPAQEKKSRSYAKLDRRLKKKLDEYSAENYLSPPPSPSSSAMHSTGSQISPHSSPPSTIHTSTNHPSPVYDIFRKPKVQRDSSIPFAIPIEYSEFVRKRR